jgi:4-amino-4-deoxy-L-arabinose transferase-like glycosyltransferase
VIAVTGVATFMHRTGRWVAKRIPELALVVFALLLRLSLARWYDVALGYDFPSHEQYVHYLMNHHSLPPYDLNFSTCSPALFYALAALMVKAGFTIQAVGRISIVSSCVQLLLVWLGLELYLRESRLARVLALALAAVVPAALHIAGMLSNQALSDVFCTGAIVLMPQVLSRRGRASFGCAAGAGACLGLALLTKISGAVVLGAFLVAVAIAILRSRDRVDVVRGLLPGTAVLLAVLAVVAGWHYVRHKVLYGKFVLTAYDPYTEFEPTLKGRYLDRRTLGFVSDWDEAIYKTPYWPTATQPHAHFWPLLVATTFSDYYNFNFVRPPAPGTPTVKFNSKPMRVSAILPSRGSVVGGTALALLAVAAWLISARRLWRRGDDGRLVLLLVGLCAVLGQLHFAIRFPNDNLGPIKGAYLQFAGPVYCALAGLAIATLWNRRGIVSRLLALGGMAAITLVATYTVFAKIVVPLGL